MAHQSPGLSPEILNLPNRPGMKLTAEEIAARLVIHEIVKGRDSAVQIPLATLAGICVRHGLFRDLPALESCGMEQLWRDRLTARLCRLWCVLGRHWRVSCPWGGNFRLEPVRRKRTKR